VVKIPALVFDMLVDSGKVLDSNPSPVTGFLSPADFSMCPAEFGVGSLVIPGIVDCCAVTEHGKAGKTHINADCVASCR
jgi:hypothetical protein